MTIINIDTDPRRHVAPRDLAEYLSVTQRTIYHWIAKGALFAIRIEGTVRIPIAEARRISRGSNQESRATRESASVTH